MSNVAAAARPQPEPIAAVLAMSRRTVRSLAAQVGCSEAHLARVVRGDAHASPVLRFALSAALGREPSDLFR